MNTFEDDMRALNDSRTVVAHSYVCNNLLENRSSFLEFLVLCFCSLKLGAKFLGKSSSVVVMARQLTGCTSIFPRWKNLASCPG